MTWQITEIIFSMTDVLHTAVIVAVCDDCNQTERRPVISDRWGCSYLAPRLIDVITDDDNECQLNNFRQALKIHMIHYRLQQCVLCFVLEENRQEYEYDTFPLPLSTRRFSQLQYIIMKLSNVSHNIKISKKFPDKRIIFPARKKSYSNSFKPKSSKRLLKLLFHKL